MKRIGLIIMKIFAIQVSMANDVCLDTNGVKDSIISLDISDKKNESKLTDIVAYIKAKPQGITHVKITGGGDLINLNIILTNSPLWSKLLNLTNLTISLHRGEDTLLLVAKQFFNLPRIRSVNISMNKLDRIPIFVDSFRQMEALYLDGNPLRKIDESEFKQKNIRVLSFANCSLSQLPNFVTNLSKIEELDITNNAKINMEHVAVIGLKNLKRLSIFGCNLNQFPLFITRAHSLQYLDASNNFFQIIPNEILNLTQLESLLLANNPLKYLTPLLFQLPKLKELALVHCSLQYLPDSIVKNNHLLILRLDRNELKSLPTSFINLEGLKELWLSNNKIFNISSNFAMLKKIQHLDLSCNQLRFLPELSHLTQLKSLNISNNPFTEFPKSVIEIIGLEMLHIYNCNISDINLLRELLCSGKYKGIVNLDPVICYYDIKGISEE